MATRFVSNLLVLIIGAFLAAAHFAFGAQTGRWLTLGAGCAVAVIVAAAFLVRGRGPAQRSLDAVTAVIAGWAIVSSLCFTGSVGGWLTLGEAGAFSTLSVFGLILHEALMEAGIPVPAAHPKSSEQQADGRPPMVITPASTLNVARRSG
jgi:hypothetical protein